MNKKEIAKEFTRQVLDQNTPSINFEQVTNMLRQIEQTHRDVLNDMESFRTKASNAQLFVYRPSFTAQIIRAAIAEADRKAERAVDGAINSVLKIPKVIPLKTLLDAYSRRNNLSAANEPDMVDRELKEEQQRKRRRGLRM